MDFFSDQNLINLFIKLFAIVLGTMYLFYAVIVYRQTNVMLKAIEDKNGLILRTISFIQIFIAIILIILAFIII